MKTPVAIVRGESKDKLVDDVAEQAGFWETLERAQARSKRPKDLFRIAIKVNLMIFMSREVPEVATDPEMVEHLIGRLRERGYRSIAVVESQNTMSNWVKNRSVANVARVAGYTGRGYRIVDLTVEKVPHVYHVRGLPAWRNWVGVTWRDADFRIDFAKFKTQLDNNFTLCLKNEFGTLPLANKYLHYHTRRPYWACTLYTLVNFPVHFGLVDAFLASDGALGFAVQYRPKLLKMALGSPDIIALDVVGAHLMGVDPLEAPILRFVIRQSGEPEYTVIGDDTPLREWENVPGFLHNIGDVGQAIYLLSNTGAMMGILNLDTREFPPRFAPMRWWYRILNGIMLWISGRRMRRPDRKSIRPSLERYRKATRSGQVSGTSGVPHTDADG